MTTSRLYASKKFMGALLLMMVLFYLPMRSFYVLHILWKVLIIVCS